MSVGSGAQNQSGWECRSQNKAAIAINQDSAAFPPKVVAKNNRTQVWIRHLHNGDVSQKSHRHHRHHPTKG